MKYNFRHSMLILTFLLVGLMSMFAMPLNVQAVGTIYYVDCASGNDLNNGLSAATAWRSTARANQQTPTGVA